MFLPICLDFPVPIKKKLCCFVTIKKNVKKTDEKGIRVSRRRLLLALMIYFLLLVSISMTNARHSERIEAAKSSERPDE